MPTTPFIGISILIHAAIIIFHKVFKLQPRERKPVAAITRWQFALSGVIVLSMFSLMLLTAFGLISASVTERHSTIYLVEDTAQWVGTQASTQALVAEAAQAYAPRMGSIAAIAFVVLMLVLIVPRLKFNRSMVSNPQGGHSAVSVSLFISGILSILVSVTYLVLYLIVIASRG